MSLADNRAKIQTLLEGINSLATVGGGGGGYRIEELLHRVEVAIAVLCTTLVEAMLLVVSKFIGQ